MKRKIRLRAFGAAAIVCASFSPLVRVTSVHAQPYTYTGPASGNWSNPANWNVGSVPNDAAVDVTIDGRDEQASSVTIDQVTRFNHLHITTGDSATLAPFQWLHPAGGIAVDAGGTLALSNQAIIEGGLLETGGSGIIKLQGRQSYGELSALKDVTIHGHVLVGTDQELNLIGSIQNAKGPAGTGVIDLNGTTKGDYYALLATDGGPVRIWAPYDDPGEIRMQPGNFAQLTALGGDVMTLSNQWVHGRGLMVGDFKNGDAYGDSKIICEGPATGAASVLQLGQWTTRVVQTPGSEIGADGPRSQVTLTNKTTIVGGKLTSYNGGEVDTTNEVTLIDVTNTGTLHVEPYTTLTASHLVSTGTILLDSGTLNATGGSDLSHSFINVVLGQCHLITGQPLIMQGGTLLVSTGFTPEASVDLGAATLGAIVVNNGVTLSTPVGANVVARSGGTIRLPGGTSAIIGTDPTSRVVADAGGTIVGLGMLTNVLVKPDGTLSPGGVVLDPQFGIRWTGTTLIAGGLELQPQGRIVVDVAQPGSAQQRCDVVQVVGPATLNGQIEIRTLAPDALLPGDTVTAVTYTSHAGTPSILNDTGYAGLVLTAVPSETSLSVSASALPGDANLDARVDLTDFTLLAANFNTGSGNWLQGDFNHDAEVDLTDFTLLAKNFNQSLTASAGGNGVVPLVPEPALAGLVIAAGGVLIRRLRVRTSALTNQPSFAVV
jgi:hypothetical protein